MSYSPRLFSQKPVYFGGSRHFAATTGNSNLVLSVLDFNIQYVHVGCQRGADALVSTLARLEGIPQHVFCVGTIEESNGHVRAAYAAMQPVTVFAGGTRPPMRARYLLRSKRALVGCSAAVFFSPGPGSLAVAREAVAATIPVYAFQQSAPAQVPTTAGKWVKSSFHGFTCWYFEPRQVELF